MILEMYSVYDKQVKAFTPPFYVRTRGEAIRSFTETCNDVKTMFFKYALDYEMVFLGKFDDQSGIVTSVSPERVIGAIEVIAEDRITHETMPTSRQQ